AMWWKERSGGSLLLVTALVFAMAAVLFAGRGLFIGEPDNDVWEHYLHYYDLVIQNHSIRPNDVWVHFFVSKAAGMFFLASLLGDTFSVQLVSSLATLLMALVGYVFVRCVTRQELPALIAALLLLASWNLIGGEAGSV